MRKGEGLGEFSSNYNVLLDIEPGNWKSVSLMPSSLPTALIVAKFVGVYLAPSNISVDLAMSLYSL
ncbi:MAG: hypothetical protein QXW72_05760 [Conexivisphaerales archaeon]